MYHLYNLIQPGDVVRSSAVRRVQSESSTGSVASQRVKLHLTIQVTKSNFDASSSSAPPDPSSEQAQSQVDSAGPESGISNPMAMASADGGGATLHLSGRVVEENNHVKMGAFHTLDVERHRTITIEKEGGWDRIHLERLEESSDAGNSAEVGAVVLGEGESGVIDICREPVQESFDRRREECRFIRGGHSVTNEGDEIRNRSSFPIPAFYY